MKTTNFLASIFLPILFFACGAQNISHESILTEEIKTTCDTNDPLCFDMVHIEGGAFLMGSDAGEDNEKPAHSVTVKSFQIMSTEITRNMYKLCIDAGACNITEDNFEDGNLPAGYISWDDTQTYIDWLNKRQNMDYRLPTEAEWEYAARAGTTSKYYWGEEPDCTKANYLNCLDDSELGPTPIKSYESNKFGLYDMTGNVWEWTQGCAFAEYPISETTQPTTCEKRVHRGGSWTNIYSIVTPSFRAGHFNDHHFIAFGFRLAHDL